VNETTVDSISVLQSASSMQCSFPILKLVIVAKQRKVVLRLIKYCRDWLIDACAYHL